MLRCRSFSPRDPLRWARAGARFSCIYFVSTTHAAANYAALQSLAFSEAFAYAPLPLLFPTRPAALGSRGGPFCLYLFCTATYADGKKDGKSGTAD